MNYKKKNGKRRKDRFHGFRFMDVRKGCVHGYNYGAGGAVRRHVRASMAIEEYE